MKRLLIADDDPMFVELVRAVLPTASWEVSAAHDSMQVMMYAMRAPAPEVILLDINMPGGTGINALKRLKQSVKTALIPVVVVSGAQDPMLPDQVRLLGAKGFIPKPIDATTFESDLLRLIG
jgi:DNA-binding NarL/FixJ family response regulator